MNHARYTPRRLTVEVLKVSNGDRDTFLSALRDPRPRGSEEADTVGVGNQHTQTDADEINCQNPVSERSEVGLHRIRNEVPTVIHRGREWWELLFIREPGQARKSYPPANSGGSDTPSADAGYLSVDSRQATRKKRYPNQLGFKCWSFGQNTQSTQSRGAGRQL
ncbi:hypothetical protein VTN49DRAFT_4175 [Thermomyces lanuginosus]|uniref:uncharacterized protein n=1 Tax=Thermomyces lanuginosus TaxID=5541 RepID=UPI0037443067